MPRLVQETAEDYTTNSNVSVCGVAECASSFLQEVSFSLNHARDPIQGCSTGIQVKIINPILILRKLLTLSTINIYRILKQLEVQR
jgi:hypothetical protein